MTMACFGSHCRACLRLTADMVEGIRRTFAACTRAAERPFASLSLTCELLSQTNATTFNVSGNTWLVMIANSSSDAMNSVAGNPGHPHIGLWLASDNQNPMIMAVIPSYFSDGSPIYFYVPGESQLVPHTRQAALKVCGTGSRALADGGVQGSHTRRCRTAKRHSFVKEQP